MTNWARVERRGFVDALANQGPEAPTLCEGWTTRDLAAHVIVRERRPDAALGIVVPALASYSESVRQRVAAKPWPTLLDAIRNGPPTFSPTALDSVDALVNTVEFFVHQEDVRRAQPGTPPRALDRAEETALWDHLTRSARFVTRRSPTGLVFRTPGLRDIRARAGTPEVTVEGAPGELVLFAFGRQAHAQVEVVAPPETAERLRAARFGL